MLTTFNEVDMSEVIAMRNQYKDEFQNNYGVKLGFMSFFVKACVIGLKNFPAINSEIQAEDGIRDDDLSRGLGDVYKRQAQTYPPGPPPITTKSKLSILYI